MGGLTVNRQCVMIEKGSYNAQKEAICFYTDKQVAGA